MAIFYNYTITVNGNKASMDKNIYLYRKNKNVDYYFEIKNACFKFEDEINYIISYNAKYARFRVIKPDGTKFFTEKREVENGYAKFSVTEDLIDERAEVGTYVFQIDLYDGSNGFITIPPVYNQFHVLEPLFDDIEEEDIGRVDISSIDVSYVGDNTEKVVIFKDDGSYIKTIWKKGDLISSKRMNKIEEGISHLDSKITEESEALSLEIDSKISTLKNDTDIEINKIKEQIADITFKPITINYFRSNLSKTVYEKDVEKINNCVFTWNTSVTPKTINLTDCSVKISDTSYTYSSTISDTKTFTLSVTDTKNNIKSSSITFSFVHPFYYGTFSDSLTEAKIKSGTKLVELKNNKTLKFSYTDMKLFYSYPKEYGILKSIKDNNGFDYINDFDKEEITINNIPYYVYKIKDKSSINNMNFTFNF